MPVLETLPTADLGNVDVLMVSGSRDPLGDGSRLADWLAASGATLDMHVVEAVHELTPEDTAVAQEWFGRNNGEDHG
ncbi:hypothetical protein FJ548_00005 [Mesorhizobium sp. B2-4-17]|nr:hypothetical protein FJ548_00005 [Mesorhizobium sp. B2-4-17]